MNEFYFENQGTNTYLVCGISADETIDSMSLGMLTNNKIPGLAPAVYTQIDSTKYIKYNISAKISADQVFSGMVNRKRLIGVFKGIVEAMISAEEYMLDINSILLDLKYIFTDVTTCESVVICMPVIYSDQQQAEPKEFFKQVMYNTRFDQTENCDYIAKIINYLNGTAAFSLAEFKKMLDTIDAGSEISAPTPRKEVAETKSQPAPKIEPQTAPEVIRQPEPAVSVQNIPIVTSQPVSDVQVKSVREVNVPPAPAKAVPTMPEDPSQVQTEEKKISMWYLLQHYNKENADAYKQQKENKKAAKKAGLPEVKPKKKVKKTKEKKGKVTAAPSFAVPGQETDHITVQPQPTPVQEPAVAAAAVIPQITPTAPQQVSAAPQPVVAVATGTAATGLQADFGDTNFFNDDVAGDSDTVILGAAIQTQQIAPHLLRRKNNEKIPINKQIFRLGRDCDFNDYAIVDNKYIGHSHCHIITRDGEYFVLDDNSKNHTMVNATIIPSGVEVKIAHGDIVCLADEEFEFKLF